MQYVCEFPYSALKACRAVVRATCGLHNIGARATPANKRRACRVRYALCAGLQRQEAVLNWAARTHSCGSWKEAGHRSLPTVNMCL